MTTESMEKFIASAEGVEAMARGMASYVNGGPDRWDGLPSMTKTAYRNRARAAVNALFDARAALTKEGK